MSFLKRHICTINLAGGALLTLTGLAMVTGIWTEWIYRLQSVMIGFTTPIRRLAKAPQPATVCPSAPSPLLAQETPQRLLELEGLTSPVAAKSSAHDIQAPRQSTTRALTVDACLSQGRLRCPFSPAIARSSSSLADTRSVSTGSKRSAAMRSLLASWQGR